MAVWTSVFRRLQNHLSAFKDASLKLCIAKIGVGVVRSSTWDVLDWGRIISGSGLSTSVCHLGLEMDA
jgi:hypothetical protein